MSDQTAPSDTAAVDPSLEGPVEPVYPTTRRAKNSEYAGVGKPSKFRKHMLPTMTRLAAQGCTDAEIARRLGIGPPTLVAWKKADIRITEALKLGREAALDRVEKALMKRALGWVGPTEKVLRDGTVVRHKQFHPPETQAAMDVLTNRRPDQWKRKVETNQQAISVQIISPMIAAALAGSPPDEQEALPHDQTSPSEET